MHAAARRERFDEGSAWRVRCGVAIGSMHGQIRVETEHGKASGSLVTQGGPLVLDSKRLPHAEWSRKLPIRGLRPTWRMVAHNLLEAPAYHFGEAQFVLAGESFRLVIERDRGFGSGYLS